MGVTAKRGTKEWYDQMAKAIREEVRIATAITAYSIMEVNPRAIHFNSFTGNGIVLGKNLHIIIKNLK